jgi:hypothetical protein
VARDQDVVFAEAVSYVESGRAVGKVVIRIAD